MRNEVGGAVSVRRCLVRDGRTNRLCLGLPHSWANHSCERLPGPPSVANDGAAAAAILRFCDCRCILRYAYSRYDPDSALLLLLAATVYDSRPPTPMQSSVGRETEMRRAEVDG